MDWVEAEEVLRGRDCPEVAEESQMVVVLMIQEGGDRMAEAVARRGVAPTPVLCQPTLQ